ncbi:MAG: hypothetical protein IJ335_10810 [Lachnospiraceae bacterium]|nr:hypothetical protein [Lachnospiraceae bacterium]
MKGYEYADCIADGKQIRDWVQSDQGMVDYEKSKFGVNVSKVKDYVIFDLGDYEYDDSVNVTKYHNGLDLSRVAGCIKYNTPYGGMKLITAINGDDYVRVFYGSFEEATIQDFVLYFLQLLDGDIYISDYNYRVYAKGRKPSGQEEWEAAVHALYEKCRKR